LISSSSRDGIIPSSLSSVVPAETELDRGRDGPASVPRTWFGLGDKGDTGCGGWKACNFGFELDSHKLLISTHSTRRSPRHEIPRYLEGTY
jgi:hypothetical protein